MKLASFLFESWVGCHFFSMFIVYLKGEDEMEEEDAIRMPADQQEDEYGYEDEVIESAGEDVDDDKVLIRLVLINAIY